MKLSELIENLNKVKESNGDIVFESKYNYIESFDMYEFNKLFSVTAYNTLLIGLTEEL